jgi:hypothetical protein
MRHNADSRPESHRCLVAFFSFVRENVGLQLAVLVVLLGVPSLSHSEEVTLHSGHFDNGLMLAADHEGGSLTGYFNDGRCRLYFSGQLIPTELYQRADFGEAYIVNAWTPGNPNRTVTTEVYSAARGGFQRQVTLEFSGDKIPKRCRDRVSVDRSDNVSKSVLAVRVVRMLNSPLYRLKKTRRGLKLVRDRGVVPPLADSGVWIERTYSPQHSRKGYAYIIWYRPRGTPHAAYIREDSFYPLPSR